MARDRKLPNGAGSVYQRKSDGLWVGAAYVLTSDGTRRRKVVYGRSWEQAHGKVLDLLDRDRRGIPAPTQAWKLGEYLDYWLEHVVAASCRPATYAQYETMVRLYLKPQLGRHRLDRLSVAAAQTFVTAQLVGGHSRSSVQVMVKVLSAALTRAMREEILTRNVARLVSLPPPQTKPRAVDRRRVAAIPGQGAPGPAVPAVRAARLLRAPPR